MIMIYRTGENKEENFFSLFPVHCSGFICVYSSSWKKRTWNTAPVSMEVLSSMHKWQSKVDILTFHRKIEDDFGKTLISFQGF